MFENLIEINRNKNGDYYFIYSVPEVINHIRPGSKSRNEVIIIGVPQKRLREYLEACFIKATPFVDLEEPV